MAKIIELSKLIPELGRENFNFIVNPRSVVTARESDWSKPIGIYSLAGTMVAIVLTCFSLYGLIFGSIQSQIRSALLDTPTVVEKKLANVPVPKYVDWGLHAGYGIGVKFPESFQKQSTNPQSAIFSFGAAEFLYKNVIPEKIMSGSAPLILQLLFATLIAACIHPFAILLKGQASFTSSLKYAILLFSYTIATASLLAIMSAIIFIEFIGLKGWVVILPWSIIVLIPSATIGFRGYFSGYSELYAITKKRVMFSTIGAVFLSCIIGPIFCWPLLHLILIFQPYLDVVI